MVSDTRRDVLTLHILPMEATFLTPPPLHGRGMWRGLGVGAPPDVVEGRGKPAKPQLEEKESTEVVQPES